jgi:hypothetical protein
MRNGDKKKFLPQKIICDGRFLKVFAAGGGGGGIFLSSLL